MVRYETDPGYVLVLGERDLGAMGFASPPGAVLVACPDVATALDRARLLSPRCAVVHAAALEGAATITALRAAAPGILVALAGTAPAGAVVDEQVPRCADARASLARFVRFALGHRMREHERHAITGSVTVSAGAGQSVTLPLVDLSESGCAVAHAPGLDHPEVLMRLRPDAGPEVDTRAKLVRVAGGVTCFCFVAMRSRDRAVLRGFLLRRPNACAPLAEDTGSGRNRVGVGAGAAPGDRGARTRPGAGPTILGRSASIARALEVLHRVAPTDVTVLLTGETGTGKEMFARALHEGSARAARPFVAVNCAALPEALVESELFGHEAGAFTGATKRKIGRFEKASGGTLFLDEVGDLPASAQAKLLRALQERVIERVGGDEPIPVDVRLVAATNQDLEGAMARGGFRRDLFFRLGVVWVRLPPLRDRVDDLPLLVDHFLSRAQTRLGKHGIRLDAHALKQLSRHSWPGNVRELENLCTRLVALAPDGATLGPEHLGLPSAEVPPHSPLPSSALHDLLDFCEREIVRRTLDRHAGNRTQAARALGISRQALQQKLARFRGPGREAA